MSLGVSRTVVGVEQLAGRRAACSQSLAGMLFAGGRRTVTTWLRAAGVSADFQNYYYFHTCARLKSESIATQLVALLLRTLHLPEQMLLVIDNSPTKRYGPKVEGADVHHNPTPGPAF